MFIDSTPITFDELENASGGTVILADPNNPDGRTIMPDFLADRLGRLSASSGWLVVDEAFADAVPEASLPHKCGTISDCSYSVHLENSSAFRASALALSLV